MRSLFLFGSFWKNRSLLKQFTLRQVELRHKGTHLGLIWSFLNPLLMVGLYVLVFGFIFDGKFRATDTESRIEYALTVFLGLAVHHFVAEVLTTAPTLIVSNPNFVKKVVFPLEILPAANVGVAAIHFFTTVGLVFIGALLSGVPIHLGTLWLPILFLPLLLTALGLALGLAALGVFWRDLAQITQFLVLVLLFASAVFYPLSKIPPNAWLILKFNPVLQTIEQARHAFFWGRPLNTLAVVYTYFFAVFSFITGSYAFHRLKSAFADVL